MSACGPWRHFKDLQEPRAEVHTWCDASWAGCNSTMKSTSGGVIHIESHTLRTCSKSQSTIALPSAELERYAMARAASESLGMATLLAEFGKTAGVVIHVDAGAALGIARREGLWGLRHLQTNAFWRQSQSIKKFFRMAKVDGSNNRTDVLTKCVPRDMGEKHIMAISCEFRDGSFETAAQLHSLMRKERQLKHQLRNVGSKWQVLLAQRRDAIPFKIHIDFIIKTAESRSHIELRTGIGNLRDKIH